MCLCEREKVSEIVLLRGEEGERGNGRLSFGYLRGSVGLVGGGVAVGAGTFPALDDLDPLPDLDPFFPDLL